VLDAIVEYERFLVTPSRFDRWLGGADDALSEEEQRGLRAFVDTGCTTCHSGQNLGGDSYQRMGLVNDYFERRGGRVTEADLGRFNVTQNEEDRHKFKVPTLRNIELTWPYFHDGSERDLAGAVRTMAHVQLGRELGDADVTAIVAFLRSLTGELPEGAQMPAAGEAPAEAAANAEGESEG
jgi:cytochrome c peroxidase